MTTDETIASICHEACRAWCTSHGDFSHVSWADTPQNIKDSVIAGVIAARSNKSQTPEMSHQSWLDYKEAEGWTYGVEKDYEAKTHPAFVPYALLPEHQKVKDRLFLAVVRSFD